jgi:hypothetical protein
MEREKKTQNYTLLDKVSAAMHMFVSHSVYIEYSVTIIACKSRSPGIMRSSES